MDKQLIILPFDHRASFYREILKIKNQPNSKDKKKVIELKNIIYQGLLQVKKQYPDVLGFSLLVDEEHGDKILKSAKKNGVIRILTTEKSGQTIFDFEYGNNFSEHINKYQPEYAKVLVRYNPQNKTDNIIQLKRLKKLSAFCQKNKIGFLFELLVPPTEKDLKIAGSKKNYDQGLRIIRTVQAINEIKKILRVSVWKLEGFNTSGWEKITKAVGNQGKIVILGRGETPKVVKHWLSDGAKFPQTIGFAIGRTIFENPLKQYVVGKLNQKQTIDKIARNLSFYLNIWLKNKKLYATTKNRSPR